MAHGKESIIEDYWGSIDNISIYLSNLSPYYLFSVAISISAVLAACWYGSINKFFSAEPQKTNELDEEPEYEEELKKKTAKLKDSLHSQMTDFPDSLITEEFVHNDLTESTGDNSGRVSPEDTPGGDGNYKQEKDQKEKAHTPKSGEDDDSYDSLSKAMSRFKKARQAAIIERVTGDMSEEQLMEEKEAEATQIAAIWDLLKQQKEQFNIGTEQELQEQLHLYCL